MKYRIETNGKAFRVMVKKGFRGWEHEGYLRFTGSGELTYSFSTVAEAEKFVLSEFGSRATRVYEWRTV